MFYSYARLALTISGLLIGLAGLYMDIIVRISYKWLVWIGITFFLVIGGFATGGLIQKLSVSSHTDFLTGLFNRRYFHVRLDEEKARANRKKTPLCIAMIDVDDFKAVNDTYGHATGDALLSDLAAILKKNTRGTDIVTRWGGDEFAIIFADTSLADACEVMERIRSKIAQVFLPYRLTISTGIISLEPDQDFKGLLIKADQALYKAKTQKNTVITLADL